MNATYAGCSRSTYYLHHFNTARPHRTLAQLAPAQAATQPPPLINLADYQVRSRLILDGLTSEYQAGRIFHDALAALPRHGIDELRAEETELIDRAVNSLMSIATDNNTSARIRVEAWSAIRGWADRKARLLGLDAPQTHAVLTLDALDAQIAALEAELGVRASLEEEEPGVDD
jgi:hypothetical protein